MLNKTPRQLGRDHTTQVQREDIGAVVTIFDGLSFVRPGYTDAEWEDYLLGITDVVAQKLGRPVRLELEAHTGNGHYTYRVVDSMNTPTKTARWVDASAIYGTDAVKLVTSNGATIAKVRAPWAIFRRWHYTAGRSHGDNADSKADGITQCERWARSVGYTIEKEPIP